VIARGDRGELDLLPPRARSAGDDARGEAAGAERDRERFGRIQNELVALGAFVARPLAEQAREVPSRAGGVAGELARVYADAHRRCSIAR